MIYFLQWHTITHNHQSLNNNRIAKILSITHPNNSVCRNVEQVLARAVVSTSSLRCCYLQCFPVRHQYLLCPVCLDCLNAFVRQGCRWTPHEFQCKPFSCIVGHGFFYTIILITQKNERQHFLYIELLMQHHIVTQDSLLYLMDKHVILHSLQWHCRYSRLDLACVFRNEWIWVKVPEHFVQKQRIAHVGGN